MSFYEHIYNSLKNSSIKEASILVDGRSFTVNGKIVYVEMTKDWKGVKFFYRTTLKSLSDHMLEKTEVTEAINILRQQMLITTLFGIKVGGSASPDKCIIKVDPNMGFLILESQLYASVKRIANTQEQLIFAMGETQVPITTCNQLKEAFKRDAYKTYGDLVYRKGSNKFTNKLHRKKEFYNIQRAFIPVFIDYENVFNPLKNNPIVESTQLYQTAITLNRIKERDGVSCYYLTHLEICKALHMDKFVRFTSAFLYKFFVGLMFPDHEDFPAANRDVFVRDEEVSSSTFKSCMGITEFSKLVMSYKYQLNDPEISTAKKDATQVALDELNRYTKKSSLLYLCEKEHNALAGIGSISLDNESKKTAQAYFGYLRNASLI